MDAGTVRRASSLAVYSADSTVTPIQMFSAQGSEDASSLKRLARFVKIWNVCCLLTAMVLKTDRIKSNGTSSWKRSLMELTNTLRGSLQVNGRLSIFS